MNMNSINYALNNDIVENSVGAALAANEAWRETILFYDLTLFAAEAAPTSRKGKS